MSFARLKRLQRLEEEARRCKPAAPYVEPFEVAAALLAEIEAIKAGKACALPMPEPSQWKEATQAAFDRTVRELDRIAERLRRQHL
jgi:hypothetical protein